MDLEEGQVFVEEVEVEVEVGPWALHEAGAEAEEEVWVAPVVGEQVAFEEGESQFLTVQDWLSRKKSKIPKWNFQMRY